MKTIKREITPEDYEKAKAKSADVLVSDAVIMGYGLYGSKVYMEDGKYYLEYIRGDSCD